MKHSFRLIAFITLLFTLSAALDLRAQLGTVPYVFSPGNPILSAQTNYNNSVIFANALNRTGGTMTGALNTVNIIPTTDSTYSIGNTSFRYLKFWAVNVDFSGTALIGGVATFTAQPILSSLTASQAVFTDGSKGLVSNAITGTGNVAMSASPTFTGTVVLPAVTVGGVMTFNAQPIMSGLTASVAVFSDASKGLVSNAITGTGNVVMSASPTLTGTIAGASETLSGTLGVTGVATLTAQPILSSLTASQAVFTDSSKGLVSNAITGTGSVVMSASPTLTGTLSGAAATFSSTLGVTGTATLGVVNASGNITLAKSNPIIAINATASLPELIWQVGGVKKWDLYDDTGGDILTWDSAAGAGKMTLSQGGNLGVAGLLTVSGSATPLSIPNATATTGTALIWDASGYVRPQSSSLRYKTLNPVTVTPGQIAAFVALSPKGWDYTGQRNGAFGFIAEDLNSLGILNSYGVSPLVNYDAEGRPDSNRDFAIIGLQHLVLQDHDARIAALEAKAGITRTVTPTPVDLVAQQAAQMAEAAPYAKIKKREAIKQCRADNDVIVAAGGTPIDCTPDADAKALDKAEKDSAKAQEQAQKAAERDECNRRNKLIVKQGGTPLVCKAA